MHVGVLAFQGDFAEHMEILRALNVACSEVRNLEDLESCTHLIIPGGESTVMAKFLWESGVAEKIQERVRDGSLAVYGTCAGAILIAKEVTGKNAPKPLGLIGIAVDRNAYGSQIESFETPLKIKGSDEDISVSFIRAPKITRVGRDLEILSSHQSDPVLVQSGNILAGTFHPEMRDETAIHKLFLGI
jgi:5'-phosphate synthase pdxT subunit